MQNMQKKNGKCANCVKVLKHLLSLAVVPLGLREQVRSICKTTESLVLSDLLRTARRPHRLPSHTPRPRHDGASLRAGLARERVVPHAKAVPELVGKCVCCGEPEFLICLIF